MNRFCKFRANPIVNERIGGRGGNVHAHINNMGLFAQGALRMGL